MSAHYNGLFRQDPFAFINTYTVDIKTWFEGLMRRAGGGGFEGALLQAANTAKVGRFDLAPVGGFLGWGIHTVEVRMTPHGGIDAYWVPYHAGLGLPGYADVPRINPVTPFVFTAGMNGCAFVVTTTPGGGGHSLRVYHNQHPNNHSIWNQIHAVGQPVVSYVDFNDYGGGALDPGMNPVAFNFLYYRNGTWNYVFQPQAFNALSQAPAQRLPGQASMRSVF